MRLICIPMFFLILLTLSCNKQGQNQQQALKQIPNQEKAKYVRAKSGLRLRKTPDQKGSIIALIPENSKVTELESIGSELEIGGKKGHWTKIQYQDKTGWVFGGFLSVLKPDLK